MSSGDRQIRLSVTLSGGASLGAYHAGVLAALLTAVQELQVREPGRLRFDAIGGASAGALAAMFAAHALLNGLDPVEVLYEAWVERVTLDLLHERTARAPLGFAELRRRLPEDLQVDRWPRADSGSPTTPLGLHVSLTGLRGLRYELRTIDGRTLPAITYADWGEFVLEPNGGVEQLLRPEGASVVDFVLASAANPGAFAPELLDRSDDRDVFAARSIEQLPAGGRLWYTDGSTISSEPLGRVLALANKLNRDPTDATYVHLMIDPLSEIPEDSAAWSAGAPAPTWIESVARTLEIMPEQVLHDDLRRVQHVNRRFARLDELAAALGPHLDDRAIDALRALVDDGDDHGGTSGDDDHGGTNGNGGTSGGDDDHGDPRWDATALLRQAVAGVAGLYGKVPVHLDLISPVLLAQDQRRSVSGMLAGEVMGDFGGFVHARLRRSDFALGYDCMLAWLPGGLDAIGLSDGTVTAVTDAVRTARRDTWSDVDEGQAALGDLPRRSQLQLLRLGVHALRVLATEAWQALRPDGLIPANAAATLRRAVRRGT